MRANQRYQSNPTFVQLLLLVLEFFEEAEDLRLVVSDHYR